MLIDEGLDVEVDGALVLGSELDHLDELVVDVEAEEAVSVDVGEVVHVFSDGLEGKDGCLGGSVLAELDQ